MIKKIALLIIILSSFGFTLNAQMVLEYNTNLSEGTTIKFGLKGSVNVTINWGDGTSDVYTYSGIKSHTYTTEGIYTVSINGTLTGFYHGSYTSANKLTNVISFGNIGLVDLSSAFGHCINLSVVPSTLPSTVTDVSFMFGGCNIFNSPNVCNWDVSNITDMSGMFSSADNFNQNIGSWNVSNVTDMSGMFRYSGFNQDIENWNVSNVTDMSEMFYYAENFNQSIDSWNVSNVTDMNEMFYYAENFNQNINSWNVSNVTDMSYMFYRANFFNENISSWNVCNVTDMSEMFRFSGFNQDIGNWNVSNVTDMGGMFGFSGFNQDIGNWNVSNVTNMSGMFCAAYDFNQDISNWDVSNVTNMCSMFCNTYYFNQDIGNWDVSNVTDLSHMFNTAKIFNQNIGNWDVSNVTDMSTMFFGAKKFNQDISNWDVSNVIDMNYMFWGADNFNQDISNWDVSNVTNMSQMFVGCDNFNQNIGNWDVSNVTNMSQMFAGCYNFNQNIGNWDVGNVTDFTDIFSNATLSTINYDSLLIGWSSQVLQPNLSFHGGNSKYSCVDGLAARNILTGSNNWTITDGGIVNTPAIVTNAILNDCSSVISGGIISQNCGSPVSERGIVWGTLPNPTTTVNNGITSDGTGDGNFISTITGLVEGQKYYIRAYATNSYGTQYGQQEIFVYYTNNIAPEILTLENLTGDCSVTITDAPKAFNCSGTITGTTNDALVYTEQGTYTITWTYDDGNGNTATQTQNVIVDDNSGPTPDIATLENIIAECELTTLTEPAATDNCGGNVIITNNATLPIVEQGIHTIIWTYEDQYGNITTQNQNVIIDDVSGPVPDVVILENIVADCEVTELVAPTATDNCGGVVAVINNVTLPITTQGTTVINWTYEDENGNISTQNQNVIIEDVLAPIPDLTTLPDITAECEVTTLTPLTATDNCGGTITVSNNTTLPITSTTVIIWTYEDENGNSSTQNQNVIIEDLILPSINCVESQTINLSEGQTFYSVQGSEFDPTETADNCELASVENDFNNSSTLENAQLPVGTNTIVWTVTDNAGNVNTCSFDVTVNTYVGLDAFQQNGISVYPNPTNGIINFYFAENNIKNISISDITGKQIIKKSEVKQNEQIDLSSYKSGVYLISIQTDKEILTTKIIKE